MDTIDHPDHVKAVDDLIETLDAASLATKSNALTGGCLREEDVLKVVKLTALSAIRLAGREVIVAGVGAVWKDGVLKLFHAAEVVNVPIPRIALS